MNVLTAQIQDYQRGMGLNSNQQVGQGKPLNNEVDAKSFLIECPPNERITLYNVEYTTWSEDKVQQNSKPQGIHLANK